MFEHRHPIVELVSHAFVFIAGGDMEHSANQASVDIYDMANWVAAPQQHSLPSVPKSWAAAGSQLLIINDSGASWLDLNTGTTSAVTGPAGLRYSDIVGGATLVGANDTRYIVGGTRTTGSASAKRVAGRRRRTLSALTLTSRRLGRRRRSLMGGWCRDRIRLGYVVDWVDAGIGTLRFWTFNVGDAAISLAILLLLLIALRPGPGVPRRMADEPASTERIFVVPDDGDRRRVDRFVADVSGLSRSFVQKLIVDGRLTAGGVPIKANAVVGPGDRLVLDVPPVVPLDVAGEAIPLDVVYEDDDLLIVDKPAGLVVHPSPGHSSGTLVNALLGRAGGAEYGGIAGVGRPGIVHRLDRDTSGLLMVAKDDAAQASLMAQLKARRVKKTYLALVQGGVVANAGRVEAPIGRDPRHRTRMAVVPDGRPSITGYRVKERLPGWTLLELDLVTGRTHQIRVHLEAIGHPVAGDPVYGTGTSRRGPDGLDRLFLHAWRLELASPTDGHLIRATAPLPDVLEAVLARLRAGDRPLALPVGSAGAR